MTGAPPPKPPPTPSSTPSRSSTEPSGLVEHSFRHEYGRLVALLARRFGFARLAAVEDAVQAALLAAMTAWVRDGIPDRPTAWLYRVAHNHLAGELRADQGHQRAMQEHAGAVSPEASEPPTSPAFESEIRDDLLRMLFVCCDEALPAESRLVLALKTLCGFSIAEIAFRLFTTEANVYKRLARAREHLQRADVDTRTPPTAALRGRLSSVHAIVYLMFNEGYLSRQAEQAIRVELCDEAIRLATLLGEHPVGATPETFALLALMHLHAARLDARQDATGGLLFLEEQDRARWEPRHLAAGATWLALAGSGETVTRYHVEAAIAAEHAFAPSFAETNWAEIAERYALLERVAPSPLHVLNRAVAVAEANGPRAGLAVIDAAGAPPAWFAGHYLWDAVLADLHRRAGDDDDARAHRERALAGAPSPPVRQSLARRLGGG